MNENYTIVKIGNNYTHADRVTFMLKKADTDEEQQAIIDSLPTDCAIDSVAKTADYSVYAVLDIDRTWKRLA